LHQIPTVESNEAVPRVVPVGEKDKLRTVRVWEVGMVEERWNGSFDEDACAGGRKEYSRIDLSLEHDASIGSEGDQSRLQARQRRLEVDEIRG
jgi:hypothetical protein